MYFSVSPDPVEFRLCIMMDKIMCKMFIGHLAMYFREIIDAYLDLDAV